MRAKLPYFDLILEDRSFGGDAGGTFDRFVHWGFWEQPASATGTREDFLSAMARLNSVVLDAADLDSGQRIFDVGCGFGGTLSVIDSCFDCVRLTGINIDRRQLEVAQASVRPSPGNTIHFVAGDACRLPFPDASFDRVIAVESAFHFPSRQLFLSEAARVIKENGKLALSDFVPQAANSGPIGRWLQNRLEPAYGSVEVAWPKGRYWKLGERTGLSCFMDRDITRQTLPTYPYIKKLWRRTGGLQASRRLVRATMILQWLSRLGVVRYRVLAFRRSHSGATT
jgi:SAM-dependent methyltransferase